MHYEHTIVELFLSFSLTPTQPPRPVTPLALPNCQGRSTTGVFPAVIPPRPSNRDY